MALVSFYGSIPSAQQVAADLSSGELVVFQDGTSGSGNLGRQVEGLVTFTVISLNENTIPKWSGEDYFVMFKEDFDYAAISERLRAIALTWVAAGSPDQRKYI